MPVDPAQAKSVFLNASDLTDPAERAAYLDRECGNDAELRHRVEALLRANERSPEPSVCSEPATVASASAQISKQATGIHTTNPDPAPSPISITAQYDQNPSREILIAGRYTLQEKIGEGGMGEVWVAKQSEPVKRKVALKLIKPGMDSRAVLQRFEQERQALALMDHPNIAKVLDAGMTQTGQPFFVMELVNGLPLNKFCDELRLTPNERLELFVPICQAVQHAHQKGIVHRDLKPANILVTMIDAKPVPKVIDFGVAKATGGKLTDESLSTLFGSVIGTLEYMSPEQAGFSGDDIDTRADIYSLGVILYELLTGLRPLDAARLKKAALTEMMRIVREEEPSKPSTRLSTDQALPSLAALRQTDPRKLMNILRGDLDWVVMKCLEKHRDRRYETASALARDIQLFLSGESVEACPPSVGYRVRKFIKRNQRAVVAASLVLLALIAGFIGTAYGLVRAHRATQAESEQREIAVKQKTKAEASEALAKAQRSRAEEREQLAIDAVKKFRDAVANNPELKSEPALDSLRKTLLKEPLVYFKSLRDRLQSDKDTRPESLARLALASVELGALNYEIGDAQDALIAFSEAQAILRRLTDANPTATEFQSDLADSHNLVGILFANTGRPAEALKAFDSALAIWQKLVRAHPADTSFQNELAHIHHNVGNVLLKEIGKPVDALRSLESAVAIQQKLADANPTVTAFQGDLASGLNSVGAALADAGRPAESLQSLERALAIQEKLANANPAVTKYKFDLAISHACIGLLLAKTGKPAEALEPFESALAIQQRLVDANPTVTRFKLELARSHNNIGLVFVTTGKAADALKPLESALGIQQKLVDANPTVVQFQTDLARTHDAMGMMLINSGKPVAALNSQKAALAIWERLAREHPETPDYASRLGGLLNNIATIDVDAGRFESGRDILQRAIVWQKTAMATNPRNPQFRQFLANHLTNLIKAARALGDSEAVAKAEHELAELRDSDPAMMALDARLSAVINGDQRPERNAERLQLAQRAHDKALYASAARLWCEAIAADPKLGEDRRAQHRYHAACAAARAGAGQGNDDPKPDAAARAKLRKQAFDLLKAEFSAWKQVSTIAAPGNKELVAKTLAHWKQDADLAGIRDEPELAKWPEDEGTALKRFWEDVQAALANAQGGK